jgi:hypothetical protein
MPTPRYSSAARRVPNAVRPNDASTTGSDPITREVVERVDPTDSRYFIRGVATPTRVSTQLHAGDPVSVLWRGGAPFMILEVLTRRGPGTDEPFPGGAVVEELFVAGEAGAREVWFRNDQQVIDLKLRAQLDGDPAYVKWATRSDAFVVATEEHHYYIFRIARNQKTPLGPSRPRVTLVRDEQPLDAGIVLCQVTHAWTLTGETRYIQAAWTGGGGGFPAVLSEAAPNPISGSGSETAPVTLSRNEVETGPPPKHLTPRIVITDIQLDDALHLIFSIWIRLSALSPSTSVGVAGTITHEIEKSDGSGTAHDESSDHFNLGSIANFATHALVVNVTTGEIIFSTLLPAAQETVGAVVHRIQTYRRESNPSQIEDFPTFGVTDKGGQVVTGWNASLSTPQLSFDIDVDNSNNQRPLVETYVIEDVDPTVVPYLDVTGRVLIETVSSSTAFQGSERATDGFFFSLDAGVEVTRHRKRTRQTKQFGFAVTYLPRRATEFDSLGNPTVMPRGLALVTALETTFALGGPVFGTSRYGFFLHDVETGDIATIVGFTENFPPTTGVVWPSGFTSRLEPVTDGVFVVAGFDGRHLLWFRRDVVSDGSGTAGLRLTDVTTLAESTVVSGSIDVVDGDPIVSAPVVAVLDRHFQVLRPDFLYYPSDTDAEKGNNFAKGWSSDGTPTLDSTAEDFPPLEKKLKAAGKLKKLPSDVTPLQDAVPANDGGPVNVEDLSHTGPSWHVVQNKSALGSLLTRDP